MAGTDSMVGMSGEISEAMLLSKLEQTCMFEDPMAVDNYWRQELVDYGTSTPFFESDQPRTDKYSQHFLNLRHSGAIAPEDPYAEDGTFLDHPFTTKDVRGNAVGPNMRRHADQQFARSKFIKYYDDSSNNIPEGPIHPTDMRMRIKNSLPQVKQRMQIFDTSFDSWHNGGTVNLNVTSNAVCSQESDAKIRSIQDDAMCYNTGRSVHDLSNQYKMGWRRTTDHRFKVGKYGQYRANAPISMQDWKKNRSGGRIEHDISVTYQDQNVPKSLVLKMSDIAEKRKNEIEAGKTMLFASAQDIQFGRGQKVTTGDLGLRKAIPGAPESAHYTLPGTATSHVGGSRLIPQVDGQRKNKVIINPDIIQHMAMINKKMTKRECKNLREQVKLSSDFSGILIDQSNSKKQMNKNNTMARRNIKMANNWGDSTRIANHGEMNHKQLIKNHGIENINYENYKKNSFQRTQKCSGQLPGLFNNGSRDYDNEYGREFAHHHTGGIMGSKYTNGYHQRDSGFGEAIDGEISSRNAAYL